MNEHTFGMRYENATSGDSCEAVVGAGLCPVVTFQQDRIEPVLSVLVFGATQLQSFNRQIRLLLNRRKAHKTLSPRSNVST
jgi:hypothetical protein